MTEISTAYFTNPSDQFMYPPIVARQRLGKNVIAATNTYATIEYYWKRRFLCGPCRRIVYILVYQMCTENRVLDMLLGGNAPLHLNTTTIVSVASIN
jgi:hypothetical protein